MTFSHETALEFLRSVPPQASPYGRTNFLLKGPNFSTDFRKLHKLDLEQYGIKRRPVHVLISKGARRCQSADVKSHEFGLTEIPRRCMVRLLHGLYVCGPELLFVQMSRQLPLPQAVCLGYELCGCYSHFAADVSGFYERPPLTNIDSISDVIQKLDGLRRLGKAREALGYVREGSRSPMETVVSCQLALPAAVGGYGFKPPTLNHRVDLDPDAARLAGTSCCYIDIAWPETKTGLEYNGREFHLDHVKDRRRLEALEHMGWSIKTVEADELSNLRRLDNLTKLLEGKAPREDGEQATFAEHKRLSDELLEATRSGRGLEDALFGIPVARGSVPYHVG